MTYSFTEQLTEINHQSDFFWMKYFLFTVTSQCMFLVECPSYTGFEPELDPRLSSTSPYSVSYRSNLPSMKTIDIKLDVYDANVQKHQFSNLPAY